MTIGERIKSLRESKNLSQTELAKSLNISKQSLYKYENNIITNIPSDKIEAIARKLETTPAALMGWDSFDPIPIVDKKQEQLLRNYQQLNTVGREKLLEYSDDLLNSGKYTELPNAKKRA